MVFKELEIQGFKSFPDKVKITFDEGVTGVVGPNGSGKSNLSDAVRWALVSPSTQRTASERLDLPEPLGPTTPVTPVSKLIFTLSGKLLKPWISSSLNTIYFSFITPSSLSASLAAHCSAAFLLRPSPRATRSELKRTATTKCLS